MTAPKILVFSGSARAGSYNGLLAALAAGELSKLGAVVTRLSLRNYPLPVYDGDLEKEQGVPAPALAFRAELDAHPAIFIASPEYNSGYAPMLKNSFDWASRGLSKPLLANRLIAIGSASPSWRGGLRGLIQVRSLLELGYGATVVPDMAIIPHADRAFDEAGALKDEALMKQVRTATARLMREAARSVV